MPDPISEARLSEIIVLESWCEASLMYFLSSHSVFPGTGALEQNMLKLETFTLICSLRLPLQTYNGLGRIIDIFNEGVSGKKNFHSSSMQRISGLECYKVREIF